jgi:hypothetical protein
MQLLEETLHLHLDDVGIRNAFLNGTPIAQEIKARSFYIAKETITRINRQFTE